MGVVGPQLIEYKTSFDFPKKWAEVGRDCERFKTPARDLIQNPG